MKSADRTEKRDHCNQIIEILIVNVSTFVSKSDVFSVVRVSCELRNNCRQSARVGFERVTYYFFIYRVLIYNSLKNGRFSTVFSDLQRDLAVNTNDSVYALVLDLFLSTLHVSSGDLQQSVISAAQRIEDGGEVFVLGRFDNSGLYCRIAEILVVDTAESRFEKQTKDYRE